MPGPASNEELFLAARQGDKEALDELVRRARQGDKEAFGYLMRLDYASAMKQAAEKGLSAADAEDVIAETYIKAWRSLPRFKGDSSFPTWRHRIEENCIKDLWRRRNWRAGRELALEADCEEDEGKRPQLADAVPGPAETAEAQDEAARVAAAVKDCLEKLNRVYALLLIWRHLRGLTCDEVLDALEKSLDPAAFNGSLPRERGLSLEQLEELHSEICGRHTDDPAAKKSKRNAFDLKLFHAREALRKCLEKAAKP